jgi:MFS family permease
MLLWPVALLNYLDRQMVMTMQVSLREAFDMTAAQFGLLTSVFLWVYAVLSPFAGFVADRYSRSRTIIGSLFVWSLVTWLTGHARNLNELLAARALMGISEACYIPAALALIADYHRGPTRSLATGIHISGVLIGAALGGIGGVIAEHSSWRNAFYIFGMIGTLYAIFLMFVLRDAPPAEDSPTARPKVDLWESLVSLFTQREFLVLGGFWGLLGVVGWVLLSWLPTFLNEEFHLGQGEAGMSATGYVQTAAAVGVLFGGFLADRWSRITPMGRIYVPLIGLCIAAPGVFLAANSSLLVLAIGGMMAFGFGRNFTDSNMMPILCLIVDPRYRATGYGVLNLFSCFGSGIAVYFAGSLKDHNVGLSCTFQIMAGCLVACALMLLTIKPKRTDDGRLQQA